MVLKASLIVPSKSVRIDPCCCANNNKELVRIPINIKTTASGFAAAQDIVINDIDYSANIDISLMANSLQGIAKFTKIRHNRISENVLAAQPTAYPSLPFANEWNGLKLYGLGDFASFEVLNDLTLTPGVGVNSTVSGRFDLELWKTSSNEIVETKSVQFKMLGDDASGWLYEQAVDLNLVINDFGLTPIIYAAKLSNFFVGLKPGFVECSGDINIVRTESSSSTRSWSFSSGSTDSKYNSSFPWLNSWAIIDSSMPSASLTPFSQVDLNVPTGYRIRAVVSVSGS